MAEDKMFRLKVNPESRANHVCRNVIPIQSRPIRKLTQLECKALSVNIKTVSGTYNTTMFEGFPIYWDDIFITTKCEKTQMQELSREIATIDDTIIVEQLTDLAVNCNCEPLDFSTSGNATKAVYSCLVFAAADGYDTGCGGNLLLNQKQFYQLECSFDGCGIEEKKTVAKLLRGDNVWCTEVEDGKGIWLPVVDNTENFINVYIDWNVVQISEFVYRVYASFELMAPSSSNMICRIENI